MDAAISKAKPPEIGDACKIVPQGVYSHPRTPRKQEPITFRLVWHLCRRVAVVLAAIVYIAVSLNAGFKAWKVLYGVQEELIQFDPYHADYISGFVGDTTIYNSQLTSYVGNVSAVRNDTLYLHSATQMSYKLCPNMSTSNRWLYGNDFLRSMYKTLVTGTSYAFTVFKNSDLVLPVVDCSFSTIHNGDKAVMRVYYLLKKKSNPNDLSLLVTTFSMQDYRFPDQHQEGSIGLLIMTEISDMQVDQVEYIYAIANGYPFRTMSFQPFEYRGISDDGFIYLESIQQVETDISRVYFTATQLGIYLNSKNQQYNLNNINWYIDPNPETALRVWQWTGKTIMRDTWAWVHGIHFIFAADALFNLGVLLLVINRTKMKGKLWIGDAFVSISNSITFRAILVIISWYVNGFWTVLEFCVQEAFLADPPVFGMYTFPEIIHADLLLIFMGCAGLVGFLTRERIDPALTVFLFEMGFQYRHAMMQLLPTARERITAFGADVVGRGIVAMPAKLQSISPLRLWTATDIDGDYSNPIISNLGPVFGLFGVIILLAPIRKIYRCFYPDRIIKLSRGSDVSTGNEEVLAWKSSLTMFEVATGAALQNRVGLVSDYDNCVYIKGIKFASADGIYCNGFVMASNKWLLRTNDIPKIWGMVMTRVRFADVYVYEVDGYTVQKMARLFYPEMMTVGELLQLNTTILA